MLALSQPNTSEIFTIFLSYFHFLDLTAATTEDQLMVIGIIRANRISVSKNSAVECHQQQMFGYNLAYL